MTDRALPAPVKRWSKVPMNARVLASLLGVATAVLLALTTLATAEDSDPKPVPKGGPRAEAIKAYNAGVVLMLDKKFTEAQARFEAALKHDATMAETHNNLAFSLRAQGPQNFARALQHYDKALELKPGYPRATMYRGMLFLQMGDVDRARAEHARLLPLDAKLAAKLAEAIASFPMSEGYDSLSPQFD